MKVLAFDSWTGGATHYQRLIEAFKERKIKLKLIHLGSWGGDIGRPKSEMIGNLRAVDISSYNTNHFLKIIQTEKPAAVIFLSTHTFAHRAFNRYCQQQHIPTMHLFHGFVTVQAVDSDASYRINPVAQCKFAFSRLFKAIKYVWPTYARALLDTDAKLREWIRFGQDIITGAIGTYRQVFADDARTNICCVYAEPDVAHAVKRYGYSREKVIPVGNPDISTFGLTHDMMGSKLLQSLTSQSSVMYMDTGLVYAGRIFNSDSEFIEHIVNTNDALSLQGKHLVFKPHPQHFSEKRIISVLTEKGIDICDKNNFLSRLHECCACISEPSSVSLIPSLLGIPLFLAVYGKLEGQQYGQVLTSYPRACRLSDINTFEALLLAEQQNLNPEKVTQWIKNNAGPLPVAEMPNRVADSILNLIK
jgi:hypothetical protein